MTALLGVALVWGVAWARWAVSVVPATLWSRTHGMGVAGGLSGARSIPPRTTDAVSHSVVLGALGRQYLHPSLVATLADSFADERSAMAVRRGRKASRWRIAEAGWRTGGWFPPHLTHQTGLSVDIVTPLSTGRIPSWPHLQLGYGVDLDEAGILESRGVDFERLARLFDALCTAAPDHGLVARRFVVWEPWHGKIRGRMRSGCRRRLVNASLRHDDHVHVTFTRSEP